MTRDRRFRLTTRLRAQFLYRVVDAGGAPASHGLQIRRARIGFEGHHWGPHNRFHVELAVAPRDVGLALVGADVAGAEKAQILQTSPLLSWFLEFGALRDARLRVGQYKVPWSRQRVISSGALQFVDRSVAVNGEFAVDRNLGFDLRSMDFLGLGCLRYYAGLYVGAGRNPAVELTRVRDGFLLALGRVEYLPFGPFDDYTESSVQRWHVPKLSIGLAYAFLRDAPRTQGIVGDALDDADNWHYHFSTADLMAKWGAASLLVEAALRTRSGSAPTRDAWGAMAQAGVFVWANLVEVVARAGANARMGTESLFLPDEATQELGGGLNLYFAAHAMKLQMDVFRVSSRAASARYQARLQLQASI